MAWLTKRGSFYYIKYSLAGRKHRVGTGTDNFQIAKEKLRQFESTQARGDLSPLAISTGPPWPVPQSSQGPFSLCSSDRNAQT